MLELIKNIHYKCFIDITTKDNHTETLKDIIKMIEDNDDAVQYIKDNTLPF